MSPAVVDLGAFVQDFRSSFPSPLIAPGALPLRNLDMLSTTARRSLLSAMKAEPDPLLDELHLSDPILHELRESDADVFAGEIEEEVVS
jgi:hypothetical protein